MVCFLSEICLFVRKSLDSKIFIKSYTPGFRRGHNASFLIIGVSFLKEIGLSLQTDQLHPLKGIGGAVMFGVAEGAEEAARGLKKGCIAVRVRRRRRRANVVSARTGGGREGKLCARAPPSARSDQDYH